MEYQVRRERLMSPQPGNIKKFSSDDKLANLAGLVWKKKQSRKFEAEERRLIREADHYLRYYLVEAAISLSSA